MWLDGKPLNYDIQKSPNSQDLPDILSLNYGINIIKRTDMLQYKNIVTPTPTFYVLDEIESVDIDTELDFLVAETLYKKLYGLAGEENEI
jgi:CMP-N-acetylneuraminic acid synthetase